MSGRCLSTRSRAPFTSVPKRRCAVLLQAQVREVRRCAIHARRLARFPQLLQQSRLPVPLLHQCGLVLDFDFLAHQLAQAREFLNDGGLGGRRAARPFAEDPQHGLQ